MRKHTFLRESHLLSTTEGIRRITRENKINALFILDLKEI